MCKSGNGFSRVVLIARSFPCNRVLQSALRYSWRQCRGCPPLPIPNREVKPRRADGTALNGGRVGNCQHINTESGESIPGFLHFGDAPEKVRVLSLVCESFCSVYFLPMMFGKKSKKNFVFSLRIGKGCLPLHPASQGSRIIGLD